MSRFARHALAWAWFGGLLLAGLSVLAALAIGPSDVPLTQLLGQATDPGDPSHPVARAILLDVRLPRALGSFLVGACLSLAGVLLQAATRNPIADPYLVGTSAGATLAAVLAAPLGFAAASALHLPFDQLLPWIQPLAALLGALASVSLAFAVARAGGPLRPERVLLAGLVLTAFAGAATSFVLYQLSDVRLRAATQWLMGGVSVPSLWATLPGAVLLLAVGGYSVAFAPHLNALGLGSDAARGVGVDEARLARNAVWGSSALAAVAVSLAGIIGFVGLLVPHGLRAVLGRDHRALVPAAVLAGGAFLCWMDALARIVVAPAELPVGILTALAGAPVLVVLLGVHRRQREVVRKLPSSQPICPDPAAILACADLSVQPVSAPAPLLHAVTLAWRPGQLVAVVGPNGSGKTTLLRALAGTLPTSAGAVFEAGRQRPPGQAPDPRQLALLPQDPRIEPGLTVRELVSLGRSAWLQGNLALRLWGRLQGQDLTAVRQALQSVDLAGQEERPVDHLSGGQRQRAFLAMVLAQQAPVLLLDEPTAALDLPQAEKLLTLLQDLAHRDGKLVVVAVHDLTLACACADRLAVLHEGHLLADAPPLQGAVITALHQAFGPGVARYLPRRAGDPSLDRRSEG